MEELGRSNTPCAPLAGTSLHRLEAAVIGLAQLHRKRPAPSLPGRYRRDPFRRKSHRDVLKHFTKRRLFQNGYFMHSELVDCERDMAGFCPQSILAAGDEKTNFAGPSLPCLLHRYN